VAKVVRSKPKPPEDGGRRVSYNFEFKHQFIVGLRVNGGPTFEEVQQEIQKMLLEKYPNGVFTPSGGYILIDGRACYPWDFDYEKQDRKPGTKPPLYTLSEDERREIAIDERIQRERDRERRTGNGLATNPTHLLTDRESSRLRKLREAKEGKQVTSVTVSEPEWTEADAKDEDLVERETAKLLKKLPKPASQRRPVKTLRRKP